MRKVELSHELLRCTAGQGGKGCAAVAQKMHPGHRGGGLNRCINVHHMMLWSNHVHSNPTHVSGKISKIAVNIE